MAIFVDLYTYVRVWPCTSTHALVIFVIITFILLCNAGVDT